MHSKALEEELAAERALHEARECQHRQNLAFLSETALAFLDLPQEVNIYQYIGEKIQELTGALIVFINSIGHESGLVKVEALVSEGGIAQKLCDILGRNLVGSSMPMSDDAFAAFKTGEICRVPGGAYEFSHRSLPQAVCTVIERLLSIGDLYAIGLTLRGEVFGNVAIVGSRGREVRNLDVVKIFLGQAAIAIQRRKVEDALRESESNYRQLVEQANDHILVLQDGMIRYANPACVNTELGYTLEDFQSKLFPEFVHPDDREMMMSYHRKRLEGDRSPHVYLLRILCRDGRTRWFENNSSMVLWKGKPATLALLTDVTERREAEEKIKAQLKEKEVLLKEVHHRVKNNLQIVSSLLNLQAGSVSEPHIRGLFRDSQNRVRSMALVHEKLYQTPNLASINFADYIKGVADHLMRTFRPEGITFLSDLNDAFLVVDAAVPCGLIVNEIISNSLKHAFPGNEGGTVTLKMWKTLHNGKEHVNLEIGDDGVGLPVDLDVHSLSTLGLQLVFDLAEQLQGSVQMVKKEKGTFFLVSFPLQ